MKHSKFTLIELLIVIGIIAILASLLLPALNKAKGKAYTIACSANMKSLSLGMTNYLNDCNGFFPPVMQGTAANPTFWTPLIMAYVPPTQVWFCPVKGSDAWETWNGAYSVHMAYNSHNFGWHWFRYIDYGYNRQYIGSNYRYGETVFPFHKSAKVNQIKTPSATINLADTYYDTDRSRGSALLSDVYATGYMGFLDARHGRGVNVGWVDGHVSTQQTSVNGPCQAYSAVNNPYLSVPFNGGGTVNNGAEINYWDR